MNTKWLTNPFFVYIISFLIAILVYKLEWSDIYPSLGWQLGLFLSITFVISFFLGFLLEARKRNSFRRVAKDRLTPNVVLFLYFGYLLEFAYSGGIPIISTITGAYNYKDFTGIPTFHVFLGTFNIFYSIYIFHQYLSMTGPSRRYFIIFFLSVFTHLLVLNRGALSITIIACFFVYLMKVRRLKVIKMLTIPLSLVLVIYLFGVVGNVRYSASKEDKKLILRIGGASDEFIEGNVPAEYYWGYLYVATPIGNMQNIITNYDGAFRSQNLLYFSVTEPLPDFISKRIVGILGLKEPEQDPSQYLVIEILNAPTVYFRSYFLVGWVGVWMMFIHSMLVMLVYPFLIRKSSKYYVSGWACLLAVVFLNIFSNMWQAIGIVLLWPLLMSLIERIKFKEDTPVDKANGNYEQVIS